MNCERKPTYFAQPFVLAGNWVFTYVLTLHFVWACMMLFTAPQAATTAGLLMIFGRWGAPPVLMMASVMAAFALHLKPCARSALLFLPQQFLLLLSAGSAVASSVMGVYPDGTVRSHSFIAADQMPAILAAGIHLLALMHRHGVFGRMNGR